MAAAAELDARLRHHVYDLTLERGAPPRIAELQAASGLTDADVRAGLQRLAAGRVLVLEPARGEILMANPFSAVPTPFLVETARYRAFGNCIWDALGIPVMLRAPARVVSACGCCGSLMSLDVDERGVSGDAGVAHFAVPAARWWEDIVFT